MTRPDTDLLRILDGSFFPNDIPGIARLVHVAGVRGGARGCAGVRGFALDTSHAFANQVVGSHLRAGGS